MEAKIHLSTLIAEIDDFCIAILGIPSGCSIVFDKTELLSFEKSVRDLVGLLNKLCND